VQWDLPLAKATPERLRVLYPGPRP
jgi:hypothetical protein